MAAAEDVRPLLNKRRRKNWASYAAFDTLKAAVLAVDVRLEHQARRYVASISTKADIILQGGTAHSIPRQTLECHYRKLQDIAAKLGEDISNLTKQDGLPASLALANSANNNVLVLVE